MRAHHETRLLLSVLDITHLPVARRHQARSLGRIAHFAKRADSALIVAAKKVDIAQAPIIPIRAEWIELHGPLDSLFCLVKITAIAQRIAIFGKNVRIVRIEGQGTLIGSETLVMLAQIESCETKLAEAARVKLVGLDGEARKLNRFL